MYGGEKPPAEGQKAVCGTMVRLFVQWIAYYVRCVNTLIQQLDE